MNFSLNDINIRSILKDILNNLIIIILAGAAAFISVFCIHKTVYQPKYTSNSTLAVTMNGNKGNSYSSLYLTNEMAEVFKEVFQSDELKGIIEKDLGVKKLDGNINLSIIKETNLINLSVTSSTSKNAYLIINSALKNYGVISDYLFSNASLQILKSPNVPSSPSNPVNIKKLCLFAALITVIAVIAIIIVLSALRPTIKTVSSAKTKLDGNIIGVIPFIKKYIRKHDLKLKSTKSAINKGSILITSPRLGMFFVESIKKISTIIERHMRHRHKKVLLITSVDENEGKSSVTANIALSLSQKGYKTLIIDGDLRKPAIHKIFDYHKDINVSLSDCLSSNTIPEFINIENDNLFFIAQNKSVKNSGPLLATENAENIFSYCRKKFDYILVDTPPLGLVSDAELLSRYSDCIILVIKEDHTPIGVINDVTDTIQNTGNDFIGFVLNAFKSHKNILSSKYKYDRYNNYSKSR